MTLTLTNSVGIGVVMLHLVKRYLTRAKGVLNIEDSMWCQSVIDYVETRELRGWTDKQNLINSFKSLAFKYTYWDKIPILARLYMYSAKMLERSK